MKPILFPENQTTFDTNGIGRLVDCQKCNVVEVLNGEFELEATYPVTGELFDEIKYSRIIGTNTHKDGDIQAFRIYKISKPMSGNVTIYARHISYQLSYIPVKPFTAANLDNAFIELKRNSVGDNPFTFENRLHSDTDFAVPLPNTLRACLGGDGSTILNLYGGELEWDNWKVILHQNRGSDRGEWIRYGRNLTDLKQEENIENTITGVYAYWNSDEALVFMDDAIYSSNADKYPFKRTTVLDLSNEFDDRPTIAQLESYVRKYIADNQIGIPEVSISVSFVDLSDTKEYKELLPKQDIRLGDIVTVQFEKLGVDRKAEVVKVEWDAIKERFTKIEIGEITKTITDTIQSALKVAESKPSEEKIQSIIDKATGVLNAGRRGHVIINRNSEGWANEILFMDEESIADAHNVLRINMNGIGFSTTGYYGNYEQAWTIDGNLIADFITTGRIQGKDLSNFWDMDTGEFHVTSDNETEGIIYKNGKLQISASSVTIGNFDGGLINKNSVKGSSIVDESIGATKLTDDSITTQKLKVGAVTADKISVNAVTTETIRADAITTEKIKADSINAEKIQANAITTDKIEADAVVADKIRVDAITGKNIRGGTISIGEWNDGTVEEPKFHVDSEGNMSCHDAEIEGTFKSPLLTVDEDEVVIGTFVITDGKHVDVITNSGEFYMSTNYPEMSGRMPYMVIGQVVDDDDDDDDDDIDDERPHGTEKMSAFFRSTIRADGIRVPEIWITGRTEEDRNWWKGNRKDVWSLTETFQQIYDTLEDLQEQIDNIDTGGGDDGGDGGDDDGPFPDDVTIVGGG